MLTQLTATAVVWFAIGYGVRWWVDREDRRAAERRRQHVRIVR